MRINTPTLWSAFREFVGLPGKTRVTEIPSYQLGMFFLSGRQPDNTITEQERAEFGCPSPRSTNMEA
jgi:hypothetical protein